MNPKCKCGRPRLSIYCPRCGKPSKTSAQCLRCLADNRKRHCKDGEIIKKGYHPECFKEHRRECDAKYKLAERIRNGGKAWRRLGDKGKPPKWYLDEHPEWRAKTRTEKLAYKRDYMRNKRKQDRKFMSKKKK